MKQTKNNIDKSIKIIIMTFIITIGFIILISQFLITDITINQDTADKLCQNIFGENTTSIHNNFINTQTKLQCKTTNYFKNNNNNNTIAILINN